MTDSPTDDQLLSRVSTDETSMRLLVDRHGAYLYAIARTLTRSDTEAEDAVQETLLALLDVKFDQRSSVRTLMVSILVRQAALLRRKRRGWLRIVREPADQPVRGDPQSAIDAKLDLANLLEKLSPEHREVIVMRELEGMTYEQMSESLHVPRGTIESRLHRAREQLRTLWR